MKRFQTAICLSILLIAFASTANAQTVATLQYDVARPIAEVNAYTQVIRVDNVVVAGTPVCVANGASSTTCSLPAPSLATGTHTVNFAFTWQGQTTTTNITGIGGANNPSPVTNPKVVITVTIAVGTP
jgi:hypothetical protein